MWRSAIVHEDTFFSVKLPSIEAITHPILPFSLLVCHWILRQRGDQGHDGSIIARHLADRTLSSWDIGIQGGHGDMGTSLVDKEQVLARQRGEDVLLPSSVSRG